MLGLLIRGGGVDGVRLQRAGSVVESVAADLVIDAAGRASRSPDWLEQAGYERPAVEEVRVDLGYTTCTYRRRPQDLGGDMGAVIAPKPGQSMRAGFILAQEGERWIVSVGGWLGDHAPLDPDGYLQTRPA